MPKPIKPEHRPYLDAVTTAKAREDAARSTATARIREAIAVEYNATNKAIADAVAHGVSKEAVRHTLGVSYTTVSNRQAEYLASGAPAPTTAPVEDEPTEGPRPVTVTKTTDGFRVDLAEFTHPDVGTKVSGYATYSDEGDPLDTNLDTESDPLLADKLWATGEVQDGVEA